MKLASVIGHFGEGLDLSNGQTIKTKMVTNELKKELGKNEVATFDTHGGAKTILKAPFQCFKALKNAKNVIIFPAHHGLRIYVPLLKMLQGFYKGRRLHYVVIGGWLPEFLENKKSLKKFLMKFDGIYVETSSMKLALEKQGFTNIYVMPNFKELKVLKENELIYPQGIPLRLCTFSRVTKTKGIGDAVTIVKQVNKALGYQALALDIYGAISEDDKEWFETLSKEFPEYISYKGVVNAGESVDVLKNYFALLFPTYYPGEGFAGTLIDALSSGLPIIASDWRYNKEIVSEAVGIIYPTENNGVLETILLDLAKHPASMLKLKVNCLAEAKLYQPKEAIKPLINQLLDKD